MATHQLKQGDTEPLELQLSDRNGPVDLTSGITSIGFRMEAQNQDVYVEVAATEASETLGDGWIYVPWASGDLDTPGLYNAEVVVTKANGKIQTFPTEGDPAYLVIKVNPSVVQDP